MIISVTNRKLCIGNFEERIADIAKTDIFGVILREKDMNERDYIDILISVKKYFTKTKLIVNNFINAAKVANVENIHLPFSVFKENYENIDYFKLKGVSVHSTEEAVFAEKNGADYLIAGHIFATDCKKDLPPRGLEYLKDIKAAVDIPVLGIGGINENNCQKVYSVCDGICVMSAFMQCKDVKYTINKYMAQM